MDPETLAVLMAVYHQAQEIIPVERQTDATRMALAAHILQLAENGERNLDRLLTLTLSWAVKSQDGSPSCQNTGWRM